MVYLRNSYTVTLNVDSVRGFIHYLESANRAGDLFSSLQYDIENEKTENGMSRMTLNSLSLDALESIILERMGDVNLIDKIVTV